MVNYIVQLTQKSFLICCMRLFPDIDECALDQHGCDENADCMNLNGTHMCHCRNGYYGNGFNCTGNSSNSYYFNGMF